jgi:hypothetical protein
MKEDNEHNSSFSSHLQNKCQITMKNNNNVRRRSSYFPNKNMHTHFMPNDDERNNAHHDQFTCYL